MTLREYRPEDCWEMTHLFYETVHTVNAADYTPRQLAVWATGKVDEDAWNRAFLSHRTLVAEKDGKIVGFGDMDESGYLDKLYVHKDYQRCGIAAVICDELEGKSDAPIFTTHASITALPFFKKRGYTVIKEQQVERGGVLLTNFVMEKRGMERILLIGSPGAGKSTLARSIQPLTGLPLYYLDQLFWNADRTTVSREVFQQRLQKVLDEDTWIIDGNYSRTMEERIQRCDTVIFLDYPVEVCLAGARERVGTVRPDMPWIEEETDPEFLDLIRDFPTRSRPEILDLLAKYPEKKILVFHTREEAAGYLVRWSKS